MSKRAPSPMWVEISVGLSLKTVPPRGGVWTVEALAKHHGFDVALVTRAVDALIEEGRPEAVALKADSIAAEAIPAAAPVEDPAPGADGLVSSTDQSHANPSADAAVKSTRDEAVVEEGSRRADARTSAATSELMDVTAGETAPSIAEQVAAEAADAGRRRAAARAGTPGDLSALKVRIEAELLSAPEDGFAFLRRKWPALLQRVIGDGLSEGLAPGPMLATAIEAGLDLMARDRGEAPTPSILTIEHGAVQ
ncbi:MAG: hypothetical protein FJ335_01395 [Sphingomonadales bacterium]|nr:hypothetical protein [Sphingomonadales bacterium]